MKRIALKIVMFSILRFHAWVFNRGSRCYRYSFTLPWPAPPCRAAPDHTTPSFSQSAEKHQQNADREPKQLAVNGHQTTLFRRILTAASRFNAWPASQTHQWPSGRFPSPWQVQSSSSGLSIGLKTSSDRRYFA